jgi:glycosyltransferase involved in cell wall biosynthesis
MGWGQEGLSQPGASKHVVCVRTKNLVHTNHLVSPAQMEHLSRRPAFAGDELGDKGHTFPSLAHQGLDFASAKHHYMSHAQTRSPLRVIHFVDAQQGSERLYGKQKVVHWVMRAQRESGLVDPELAMFTASGMTDVVRADGFHVTVLEDRVRRLPFKAMKPLFAALERARGAILHTHGYKPNLVGRLARFLGAPMSGLISTCHGFIEDSWNLRLYNALDRVTGNGSSFVTAPDPGMLAKFPRYVRTQFVPNAIPDAPPPGDAERTQARARYGWTNGRFVAGVLGRYSPEKGIENLIGAARMSSGDGTVWAAAGSGPMEEALRDQSLPALQCLGYLSPSDEFLAAIDVYVQPSFTEGLSISLLEAMRAGLPIVATDVGATNIAVRDGREALLVAPDPAAIVRAVSSLRADPLRARQLGAAARQRFQELFNIEVQHQAFYRLYEKALA